MTQQQVRQKMMVSMEPCACGSGKMYWQCCGQDKAADIANEECACGSGKLVKDCCMKSPEAHQVMG